MTNITHNNKQQTRNGKGVNGLFLLVLTDLKKTYIHTPKLVEQNFILCSFCNRLQYLLIHICDTTDQILITPEIMHLAAVPALSKCTVYLPHLLYCVPFSNEHLKRMRPMSKDGINVTK